MTRRSLLLSFLALPQTAQRPLFGGLGGSLAVLDALAALPQERRVFRLDFDWQFQLGDPDGAQDPDYPDSGWYTVQLPHDWSIGLPFLEDTPLSARGDFSQKGIGWYRRAFDLPAEFTGKLLLDFDGIYQNSQIWLNGVPAGGRAYGFVPFQVDLTQWALPGQRNVLAVRVDNESGPHARWYSGSGINRHVWLTFASPVRIAQWGMRTTVTGLSAGFADLRIEIDVVNETETAEAVLVQSNVISPDGLNFAAVTTAETVAPGERRTITHTLVLRGPQPWSPEIPNLYRLHASVKIGQRIVDHDVITFGIRQIEWHPDFGFLLNGRTTKLRGVCLHLDCGPVGTGVPDQVFERRLRKLKALGCNAIRIAHQPAPAELLDLCDEIGLLVIEEAFDKWNLGFAEGFEHPNFAEDWQKDLSAMLDRDRNHPSIVAWSVGNEAGQPGDEAHDFALEILTGYVKASEPTRAVTCAFLGSLEGTVEDNVGAILKAGKPLSFLSLNYQERYFPFLREIDPSALIVASEAYPFFRSAFGAVEPFNNWYDAAAHQWVTGSFVWTGFDYLGESAGWPSRGWPNGLINSCGFAKPLSAFHRTVWNGQPMISIIVIDPDASSDPGLEYWRSPVSVDHWNLKEGVVYAVHTTSNAQSVELIVDGASLGIKFVAESANQTIVWYVRHRRGELIAIARVGEEVVAETSLRSAGEAAATRVELDRQELRANGRDVCHAEIFLVDANNVIVPDADRQIRLHVTGPGALIGMDNGDLRSPESYHEKSRTTRNGKCLAILQASREEGAIGLWVEADGVPTTAVTIDVRAQEEPYSDYPSAAGA